MPSWSTFCLEPLEGIASSPVRFIGNGIKKRKVRKSIVSVRNINIVVLARSVKTKQID